METLIIINVVFSFEFQQNFVSTWFWKENNKKFEEAWICCYSSWQVSISKHAVFIYDWCTWIIYFSESNEISFIINIIDDIIYQIVYDLSKLETKGSSSQNPQQKSLLAIYKKNVTKRQITPKEGLPLDIYSIKMPFRCDHLNK